MSPHLISSSSQVKGAEGTTVELVCRVGGDPTPQVTWKRFPPHQLPQERMALEERGQVLRIRHLLREDQGLFTCHAENSIGTISSNISLTVHCKFISILNFSKNSRYNINY